MTRNAIERTKAAIRDVRAGKMVILVDDEDRENEGDLVNIEVDMIGRYVAHLMERSGR